MLSSLPEFLHFVLLTKTILVASKNLATCLGNPHRKRVLKGLLKHCGPTSQGDTKCPLRAVFILPGCLDFQGCPFQHGTRCPQLRLCSVECKGQPVPPKQLAIDFNVGHVAALFSSTISRLAPLMWFVWFGFEFEPDLVERPLANHQINLNPSYKSLERS